MGQTSVSDSPAVGFPGLLADASHKRAIAAHNEEAADEIPFGVAVKRSGADGGVIKLTAQADALLGIVLHDHSKAKDTELGTTGLKPNVSFDVLTEGVVFVTVEGAITLTSEVHVRAIAAGAEVAGAFRATADGTDTIDITPFARWESVHSDGVAKLYVNFVNAALAAAD
jgi:hypothetical protein